MGGTVSLHYYANGQRLATRVDGSLYYMHSDLLGSTVAVSDAAGGEVGRVQYDPYGEVITSTLPADLTDRLFTGQRLDSSSGLYYYNARYYDPHLGRFIQPDTLVPDPLNPQAWNRFSYCYNNPTSYIDPTGHFAWLLAGLFVGGALIGGGYAYYQGYDPATIAFYAVGTGATAVLAYFAIAELAIMAGMGMQVAGLWVGSTTILGISGMTVFGWGLTMTSVGSGMLFWAFQPPDRFIRWLRIRALLSQSALTEEELAKLIELMSVDFESFGGIVNVTDEVVLAGEYTPRSGGPGVMNLGPYAGHDTEIHEWIHFERHRLKGWGLYPEEKILRGQWSEEWQVRDWLVKHLEELGVGPLTAEQYIVERGYFWDKLTGRR